MSPDRPHDWEAPVEIPDPPTPRKILVPFDGSQTAERALAWAELAARNNEAEVVVVVVYDAPLTVRGRSAAYVDEERAAREDESKELAESSVALLLDRGISARGVVTRGDVAREILTIAEDEGADLIVLGRQGVTHEAGGSVDKFRALMSGGVAEKVSRHAEVPVLMVV
jgi:nucleotide-binding universal stress UspA family protein